MSSAVRTHEKDVNYFKLSITFAVRLQPPLRRCLQAARAGLLEPAHQPAPMAQTDSGAIPAPAQPVEGGSMTGAVPHAEKAWAWWRSIGAPKFHVAPMVDQVGGDGRVSSVVGNCWLGVEAGCALVPTLCLEGAMEGLHEQASLHSHYIRRSAAQ